MNIILYHNPRCSKSRAVLALLEKQELNIEIVEYLKTPLGASDLHEILKKLDVPVEQLVRSNEKEYKELDLAQADNNQLIQAITDHPNLMQRPIIVSKNGAVIGRPPEKVLTIL